MTDLVPHKDWCALAPDGVGAFFYNEVTSTNDVARAWLNAQDDWGQFSRCWFIAGRQIEGRGRRGRLWASVEGNFHGSYSTSVTGENILPLLPFAVSLAVRQSLVSLGIEDDDCLCVKWPNDVLIRDRKVAGILIELVRAEDRFNLIIGIGVNLAHTPEGVRFPSTSVSAELGLHVKIEDFFLYLAGHLEHMLNRLFQSKEHLRSDWLEHAWRLGDTIEIMTCNDKFYAGIFTGVGDDGCLLLQMDSGKIEKIYAGDVSLSPANVLN